jgi:hypothetical protein
VSHLPYEAPFTVIENGLNVVFSAGNSIKLDQHFIAREGCNFIAKIETVTQPEQITIISEPDQLLPVLNYEVENADMVYTSIYTDYTYDSLVFQGQAAFDENNHATVQITNYNNILPGHYYISNLYVNDCYRNTSEYLILKINNKSRVIVENDQKETKVYNKVNINNESYHLKTKLKTFENDRTGVNQNEIKTEIKIFPNPTGGNFTLSSPTEIKSVYIYDAIGEMVVVKNKINKNTVSFNIDKQKKGLYYLKVFAGQKVKTLKIVKF